MRVTSAQLSASLLLLGAGVASAIQCDWHYRSADVTVLYNNEGTSFNEVLVREVHRLLDSLVENVGMSLGQGQVLTVSGKRFSAVDSSLKDREGNTLDLCTQTDTWGGVFTRDNLDTSRMRKMFDEETWFVASGAMEGENLALLAMIERLRDARAYHPSRLNMLIVVTERPPLLAGTACGKEFSVDALLEEAAQVGNTISIITSNIVASEAWKAICEPDSKCIVSVFPDLKLIPEDEFDLGPCDCFAEDVVNIKMSWLWPSATSSPRIHSYILQPWAAGLRGVTYYGARETLAGGSINNYATFQARSYGNVNAPCEDITRVLVEKLPRDGLREGWEDFRLAVKPIKPVFDRTAVNNAALNAITEEFLAPQAVGEVNVISIIVDNMPFLEGGECEDDPDLPRLRNYLESRPERAAFLLIHVYIESYLDAWREFCETELPGRCEVVDLSIDRRPIFSTGYPLKLAEIRRKFACNSENDPTLPPLPTTESTMPPPSWYPTWNATTDSPPGWPFAL